MKIVCTIPYFDNYDYHTNYEVGGIEYSSIENLKKDILVMHEDYKNKMEKYNSEYNAAWVKLAELRKTPEYVSLPTKYYATEDKFVQASLEKQMEDINKTISFPDAVNGDYKIKNLKIRFSDEWACEFDIDKCEFCELNEWFNKVSQNK